MELIAETHLFECLRRPGSPLRLADAGQGESQLHIGQHGLVGDEVVALEHEADGVVAVGIPVAVAEGGGRHPIDGKLSGGIPIEAAHDIEQCRFPAAGGTEDGDEFCLSKGERNVPQRMDRIVAGEVILCDMREGQHIILPYI